jgi:hypothetical protein
VLQEHDIQAAAGRQPGIHAESGQADVHVAHGAVLIGRWAPSLRKSKGPGGRGRERGGAALGWILRRLARPGHWALIINDCTGTVRGTHGAGSHEWARGRPVASRGGRCALCRNNKHGWVSASMHPWLNHVMHLLRHVLSFWCAVMRAVPTRGAGGSKQPPW